MVFDLDEAILAPLGTSASVVRHDKKDPATPLCRLIPAEYK
jgi:hypothetical protein